MRPSRSGGEAVAAHERKRAAECGGLRGPLRIRLDVLLVGMPSEAVLHTPRFERGHARLHVRQALEEHRHERDHGLRTQGTCCEDLLGRIVRSTRGTLTSDVCIAPPRSAPLS